MNGYVNEVLDDLKKRIPWEKEFIQAITEVLNSLSMVVERERR